ncbi:hypothetical protein NDU88_001214 [Pleurodeles waltl]|uniref:Uncharacterized protein n=1 Tax=Pleurodeles waltl TaxID=8319 RepID=A0AAV7NE42_PLEWA|nr:hypothetical protein NDU88_001214 [Pleurodeles waltl]
MGYWTTLHRAVGGEMPAKVLGAQPSYQIEAMTRAIGRLAQATRCTLAVLVEMMGHYSGDDAQGLQQISAAVEVFQTASIASGATGEAPESEVSSLSSVPAADTRGLHRSSSSQPALSTGSTLHAGRTSQK